jgi:hypothetical protein
MSVDSDKAAALQKAAVEALWRRANLRWMCHSTQLKILSAIKASNSKQFFALCSRRLGKSHLCTILAIEKCLQKPGARVLYIAPWGKDAAQIVTDILPTILATAPDDIKPVWHSQARELVFPNGSIIRLRGVNGESAAFLRGGSIDFCVVDELGIVDDAESVISSVLLPMAMTSGGTFLFASTPPMSTGHDSVAIFEKLAAQGATAVFTLKDAPHVTDAVKIEYLIEAGETPEHATACIKGDAVPKTTTARREYWASFCTDADSAVIPEFDAECERAIVKEWPRPPYFYSIVSMDPGFSDATGVLWAYTDFAQGKLIIEDEALILKGNTETIAKIIKSKEAALWPTPPLLRVSDVDLRLIADLSAQHGLTFAPTRKEDRAGAVNYMRLLVGSKRVIIHPRCQHLIRQMKNAVWNRKATDWARGRKEDLHFDLISALLYLTRNAPFTQNPYPSWWTGVGMPGGPPAGSWISPKRKQKQNEGLFIDTPLTRRLRKAGK